MSGKNYLSMAGQDNVHYRILVIGKSGNGKSAVGNTILGKEVFPTGRSMTATTLTAKSDQGQVYGNMLKVIDTPDITNCRMSPQQMATEVAGWKTMTSNSPSVVLLAIRCDVRYTAEEYEVFQQIVRLWGDTSLQKKLVIAFTFGDKQDEDIETTLKDPPPELKRILNKAKTRYVVFTNKDSANRQDQARQLIAVVQAMKSPDCCNCCIM